MLFINRTLLLLVKLLNRESYMSAHLRVFNTEFIKRVGEKKNDARLCQASCQFSPFNNTGA